MLTKFLEGGLTDYFHPTEGSLLAESVNSHWGFLSGSNVTEDCAHSRSQKTFFMWH